MKFRLLLHVLIGTVLIFVTANAMKDNLEPNERGRQNHQRGIHAHKGSAKSQPGQAHAKPHQAKRNELIKEQRLRGRVQPKKEEDKLSESPETDSNYRIPEEIDSETRLERAIEHTDRKTLLEWLDYATGLKGLINDVEVEARKCGCKVMYEPILDSKKRINHGLQAVSNKLRYGSVSPPKHAKNA